MSDMAELGFPAKARVGLEGEWDGARKVQLRSLLADAVAQVGRGETLLLDLRETEFIDSSALSIFLNAQRRLTRAGARMVTLCREGVVLRAIEVTHLTDTLNVRRV